MSKFLHILHVIGAGALVALPYLVPAIQPFVAHSPKTMGFLAAAYVLIGKLIPKPKS